MTAKTPPAQPRSAPRRGESPEMKLHGVSACQAVWERRREDIVRVYVTQARMSLFADLLGWCAETHRAYHLVTNVEMERITQSTHHEGVCLLARAPKLLTLDGLCMRVGAQTGPICVLLLDDVANPHNLGAVLRVAAHFGATAVVCAAPSPTRADYSAALCRTAAGAAEFVPFIGISDPLRAVRDLRRCSLEVLGTSSRAERSLYAGALPRRCLLMLGSESRGLSDELAAEADRVVAIPGTGWVESLNVACASAALLAEFRRQHPWSGSSRGSQAQDAATPAPPDAAAARDSESEAPADQTH